MRFSFAQPAHVDSPCDVARVTIDTLPDVALLAIFDIYKYEEQILEAWHAPVYVCQK